MSDKPVGFKSGYFIGFNVEKIQISGTLVPLADYVSPRPETFEVAAHMDIQSVSWSLTATQAQALSSIRVFGLQRYHFAKYHVLTYGRRRKGKQS